MIRNYNIILQIDLFLYFYKLYLCNIEVRSNMRSATFVLHLNPCTAFVPISFVVKNNYYFSVIIFCTTSAKRAMFLPLPSISPVRKLVRM
ncbi:hypothetical protein HMPREF1870_02668 [Bacteroidales bacterium KA00344]|nr:hypothetical protein HMPREF1870_02668 [Bacteroidales bacterium KA00344]